MSSWGRLRLEIFGESHGSEVGVSFYPPAGIALDTAVIARDLARRRGGGFGRTPRTEPDEPIYLCGVRDGVTTGGELRVAFKNRNVRKEDYPTPTVPRPSHCDYPAYVKYGSIPSGGGPFSGRLTIALVFAGAVARCALNSYNIRVGAHYLSIGAVRDDAFSPLDISPDTLDVLRAADFPVLGKATEGRMREVLAGALAAGDSLGGVIEAAAIGVPVGLGGPHTDSLESRASSLLFSIPAVKGVEFGDGFAIAALSGSAANDQLMAKEGRVRLLGNHSGGIQGGMANGAPVIVRAAFKPTPSIAVPQRSVDLATMENTMISVKGRHDTCVALRGISAVEAALMLALLDAITEEGNK